MLARKLVLAAAILGVAAPIATALHHLARADPSSAAPPRAPVNVCRSAWRVERHYNECRERQLVPVDDSIETSLAGLSRLGTAGADAICAAWLAKPWPWGWCRRDVDPDVQIAARDILGRWRDHIAPIVTGNPDTDETLRVAAHWRDYYCAREVLPCPTGITIYGHFDASVIPAAEPWLAAIQHESRRCYTAFLARCPAYVDHATEQATFRSRP